MYIPCDFSRQEYLANKLEFEEKLVSRNDVDSELDEFNDDPFDLAVELAYTRYELAKAEQIIQTKEE